MVNHGNATIKRVKGSRACPFYRRTLKVEALQSAISHLKNSSRTIFWRTYEHMLALWLIPLHGKEWSCVPVMVVLYSSPSGEPSNVDQELKKSVSLFTNIAHSSHGLAFCSTVQKHTGEIECTILIP